MSSARDCAFWPLNTSLSAPGAFTKIVSFYVLFINVHFQCFDHFQVCRSVAWSTLWAVTIVPLQNSPSCPAGSSARGRRGSQLPRRQPRRPAAPLGFSSWDSAALPPTRGSGSPCPVTSFACSASCGQGSAVRWRVSGFLSLFGLSENSSLCCCCHPWRGVCLDSTFWLLQGCCCERAHKYLFWTEFGSWGYIP